MMGWFSRKHWPKSALMERQQNNDNNNAREGIEQIRHQRLRPQRRRLGSVEPRRSLSLSYSLVFHLTATSRSFLYFSPFNSSSIFLRLYLNLIVLEIIELEEEGC
jgi:hypothetical protein